MTKKHSADFIQLVFYGKKLNPDEITRIIGLEPFNSARKGDQSKYGSRRAKTGFWNFHCNSQKDIHEQFSFFTKKFRKKEQKLQKVINSQSIDQALVELIIEPPEDFGRYVVVLNAKEVEFWGSLGFKISIILWNPYVVLNR